MYCVPVRCHVTLGRTSTSALAIGRSIAPGPTVARHDPSLDAGEPLAQETRGWSDDRAATYHMRSKETSDDYRYFPEPDLPPLHVDPAWLDRLRSEMPELPAARRTRFQRDLGLSAYDATVLVGDPGAGSLFESTLAADPSVPSKSVANWVTGEYLRLRNSATDDAPVSVDPAQLAALVRLVDDGSISRANAKEVFAEHASSGAPVAAVVADRGFHQISDADVVGQAVDEALTANPDAIADYKAGKTQVIGFLVGQVMKTTKGQADASVVQRVVRERLDR